MRILISMVVWAFVARHLGAEHFGIFNFALSFVFLFKVIADLGLDDLVVRELVKNEKRKDEILGTSFMLKLIGSTLAIITIVLVTKFLSVDAETKLAVIIISLRLIFQSFSVIDFYFQSKVLSKFVVFSQILGLTAIAILCPIFVFLKLPLIYFVYVIVLESVLNALGLAVFYAWQRNNLFQWKFNFDLCKSLFKDVWPLLVSGIAVSIYMRIDQIMIKHMMDATSVGYYAAAVRISEAFFFIPVIISTSLFPTIVSTKLNDEKLFYEKLQALFAILFWVALFLSVALSLLSQPIILLLYGEEYLPAAAVLAIHIWSSIFIFIGDGRYKWSVSENLQIYTMYYTLTGAVTNIVLNLLLIPAMGIKGAAIATVIAQFVACVLSSAFSRKTRKIFFLQLKSFSSLPLSLKFIMKEI
ncbi:MAG: hypothetical protein A2Z88_06320 [Omnitrophica WOR_2 bacterium GWA2_47_8]|nr:MAG: hypothetical protein A2Z88_06320 [Omnitrophica WOR_2 bacterium GWA2_47_8]